MAEAKWRAIEKGLVAVVSNARGLPAMSSVTFQFPLPVRPVVPRSIAAMPTVGLQDMPR